MTCRRATRALQNVARGYRSFADQLLRAAGATVILIAEGANRVSSGSKRQHHSLPEGTIGALAPSAARSIRAPTGWGSHTPLEEGLHTRFNGSRSFQSL